MIALLLAAGVATVAAVAFYPALGARRWVRLGALAGVLTVILASPCLVPADRLFGRFLAAVWAVALLAKLVDLNHGAALGSRPGLGEFVAYLPNLALVVWRRGRASAQTAVREVLGLAGWSAAGALGVALFVAVYRLDWRAWPFVAEHVVKVLTFYVAMVPIAHAGATALRLLGLPVCKPMDNPFAARTPADFWKRYNRPAQQFFLENVFRPLGGLRRPVRATLLTFAISGVLHEYIFAVASGRHPGFQFLFFMIQGLAVAATLRVWPSGWRTVPWLAATLVFNLATSVLFFVCLNDVVPFYEARHAP